MPRSGIPRKDAWNEGGATMMITRRSLLRHSFAAGAAASLTPRRNTAQVSRDTGHGAAVQSDSGGVPVPEPRVARFENYAFGMFIHWGLYSQLGRGEWVMNQERIPVAEYKKLRDSFTAEEFDGRAIARIAGSAGMKYITLTSRHHEGFSLYDTRGLSDYDAIHSPANRDLIRDFVDGCRAEGIAPFLYHTTLDWYQESFSEDFDAYLDYLKKSVEVLCTHYGELGGLWFDGNWSKSAADWKEDDLYSMIRRLQPEAMIINNSGLAARGKIVHPQVDSVTFEQGRPTPMDRRGMKKYVAAEMCQTMNRHWGIALKDFCYMSPRDIIENLCACRKVGANYLLNVGPTAPGRIPAYEASALERTGDWVRMHADAIYNGKPAGVQARGRDFGLVTGEGALYLFIHDLAPAGDRTAALEVRGPGPRTFTGIRRRFSSAAWMDNGQSLKFSQDLEAETLTVTCTPFPASAHTVVRVITLS
jgi:alpha-L-fucosidase